MLHRLTLAVIKARLRKISPEIEVLSVHYKNNNTPIRLRCKKCGSKWKATAHNLLKPKNSTGCPSCGQNKAREEHRLTFGEVKAKLNTKLKLLSFKSGSASKKGKENLTCEVRCRECRHEWKATLCNLVHNYKKGHRHGCPKCKLESHKIGDSELRARLSKRRPDITLLPKQERRDLRSVFKVKCKRCGETWTTNYFSLVHADIHYCKTCYPRTFGSSEQRAREVIERVTTWRFPRSRHCDAPWLGRLHLDGYSKEDGVAFEYQGAQHYKLVNLGGHIDTEGDLAKRKRDDKRKRMQCLRHGILLICIPYWKNEQEIEELIRKKLASRR